MLIGVLFRYGFGFEHLLIGALAIVAASTTSALLLAMYQTQQLRLSLAFDR